MEESIGERIVKLRRERGWTQAGLAGRLYVSDKAVSKWEQERGVPSLGCLEALADVFGVSIDYIVRGGEERRERGQAV